MSDAKPLSVRCRTHGTEYTVDQPRTLYTNGVTKVVKADCRCTPEEASRG